MLGERFVAALAVVSSLTAMSPGHAADVSDCQATADPLERLDCYDRLHGPPAAGEPAPVADASAEPADPSADPPAVASAEPAAVTIESAGLDTAGRRWYRTSAGDLWRQVTAQRTDIRAGDSVRISESGIGTYHLRRADGSSRSVQVHLIAP